jgi:hypothetical protein
LALGSQWKSGSGKTGLLELVTALLLLGGSLRIN